MHKSCPNDLNGLPVYSGLTEATLLLFYNFPGRDTAQLAYPPRKE